MAQPDNEQLDAQQLHDIDMELHKTTPQERAARKRWCEKRKKNKGKK